MWDHEGRTKIKGLNNVELIELVNLELQIIHVCHFYSCVCQNQREAYKVIVKYLKMLPNLKSDGTVSPCGNFPFLAVVHRVCGTLHRSSLYDE